MPVTRRSFLKIVPAATLAIALRIPAQTPVKHVETDPCFIVFDLDPDIKNQAVLDWLKRGDYCWGIEVPWRTEEDRIRYLYQQGWQVVLQLYAHPGTRERHHTYKKWPLVNVADIVNRHIAAAQGDASRVIWQILLEDDSAGVGHSQEILRAKPKTHAEAAAMLQRHLDEAIAETKPFGNIKRWSVCGYAGTAHHFARQPEIDLVTVERANDDIEDLQTGIAFCRGAGRQYRKLWGIDLSLWWGVINGCINDLPTSFHKRQLYVSWYSGAQHFRIEGGNLFWDKKNNKPHLIADCMDEFGRFIKKHQRGTVETPVAVILPQDHGWMTPPYWRTTHEAWNYARIPYRQGQRGIDGLFNAAFPASPFAMQPFPFGKYESDDPPATPFALSTIRPPFAPTPQDVHDTEPPLPFGRFHDRDQAREALRTAQIDPSPYRPMGQSRWGDIIDVLTEDADEAVLANYKVLILLDQIRLNPDMLTRLGSVASAGAKIVCAAGVVGPEQRDFIGAECIPELHVGHAWQSLKKEMVHESFQYIPTRNLQANPLIRASNGSPLVLENSLGSGRVITCLIPWFEGSGAALSRVALEALDYAIRAVQPVFIDGLPIEWLSTRSENKYQVLLSNNRDQLWEGIVTARYVDGTLKKCHELLSGQPLQSRTSIGGAQVAIKISPFDVAVVSWEKG